MTGEARHDAPAEDGLLRPADLRDGTWAGDEIRRTMARIEALSRELQHIDLALKAQQDEVSRLSDSVHTVEGRTQRHEVGQEQTREVRQELAEMTQRLAEEASLRRDLAAQVDRASRREAETQRELQRVLEVIATRLDDFDGRVSAEAHRGRAIADDVTEVERDGEDIDARILRLEHRVGAELESARHYGAEVARVAAAITQMMSTIDSIDARARAMQVDQRRLDDEVAALRSISSRDEELLDMVEQQRATRARLEDRVSQVEEALEELRRGIAVGSEERQVLARQIVGEVEQRRSLAERIEAQRDAVIEHQRRQARAEEESRRRMIEEFERDIRVARGLLVRLSEQSDDAGQEQPL